MMLFSGDNDFESHRIRLVLAEKGINVDITSVDPEQPPEDLIDLNPYNSVPTLVDRELALYGSQVIMEYLDERFPHPPLMPVDPVSRARIRLMLYRIERDLYAPLNVVLAGSDKAAAKARKEIADNLASMNPVFDHKPFFMNDELTLADCSLAPLLWRLPMLKINLPKGLGALNNYMNSLFAREGFGLSLSESERELRP